MSIIRKDLNKEKLYFIFENFPIYLNKNSLVYTDDSSK
jgi:hypothetical protein